MKKIICNMALLASISILAPCYLNAQNSAGSSYAPDSPEGIPLVNPGADEKPGKASIKAMKANLKAAKANLRCTDHFNSNYKGATNVKWATEENVIVATFKMGELLSRSVYDKKGICLYTVLNYYEDGLPDDIKQLVKKDYSNLNISLVQEILQDDVKVYDVHLEDEKNIKQVLVCNGEITPYKEFKKMP